VAYQLSVLREWSRANIESVPAVCGAYRVSDSEKKMLYVGMAGAGRLRERLLEHLNAGDIRRASYFRYQQCASEDEARRLEQEWSAEFKLT